ncbi:MAG: Mov34/MPN/PAD-1 family protein, partial [Thermodesulfovibrionales bacterium]|nr:Mov34/MPN/PAD-1 family protein [Thermodesulfovibrionales bacterium]
MLRRSAKNIKECLALISEHAASEAPGECCGIVLGQGSFNARGTGSAHGTDPLEVFLCTNIQDIMHENDPEIYKRDSSTAYHIDPQEQAEVFSVARAEGLDIIAFYHS